MKIINLTQTQYRNYSNIHSKRNFGQTIEYSMLSSNIAKNRLFLGLIDDKNNVQAAALILVRNITPTVKEAIAPNGFLIDYADFELVKTFTEELKKHLMKEKVTYLITNPMFKNRVLNKNNYVIENNESIYNNLIKLDYKSLGYTNDFERYDVIIENYNGPKDIYKNFNRNTKRNINECLNYGITLHKGSKKDIEEAYNIFKKKAKKNLAYYENLVSIYDSVDNKAEIFFARLNPHKYLINVKRMLEIEEKRNEIIHNLFTRSKKRPNDRLLNKKINSDNTVVKLKQELNRAIELNQKYDDNNITIGTSIVIRNNHEIYFLIDGYKEEFRKIHSTHVLKWAIIKKYYDLGYRIFNLGEIYKNYQDKNNKYYGQYMYKIGFGGHIVEYPPELILIINKPLYSIYSKLYPKKKLI